MINAVHIDLFEKYKDAPIYAYGSINKVSYVSTTDKELYWDIYQNMVQSFEDCLQNSDFKDKFYVKAPVLSKNRGIRGHRPKDLWCAIRNKNSKVFNELPQIYAILSDRGIELGFAVSIPESDYSDINIKTKAREVIPLIHKKLPTNSPYIEGLDQSILNKVSWHVNYGTRLSKGTKGFDKHQSIAELFQNLKSNNDFSGGGAICKIITPEEIKTNPVNLDYEINAILEMFAPLLEMCAPSGPDQNHISIQNTIEKFDEEINEKFDPKKITTPNEYTFRSIKRRRGQTKFRNILLDIYQSECVISGCNLVEILQAAHIFPYNGEDTNKIDNGLILRSDIHDLFDMFLISIEPFSLKIKVSPRLYGSEYQKFENNRIKLPNSKIKVPSGESINWHYDKFKLNI
jgi:hypothetical protein